MEQGINRQIGAAVDIMQTLHWSVKMKKERSPKAELLDY